MIMRVIKRVALAASALSERLKDFIHKIVKITNEKVTYLILKTGKIIILLLILFFALLFAIISLPVYYLILVARSIKKAYSNGWLDFCEELRTRLENLTKDSASIASEWFEYLKWITLIGTISVVGAQTLNPYIQVIAKLSYVMVFFLIYSDISKFLNIVYFQTAFSKIKKILVEKNYLQDDKDASDAFKGFMAIQSLLVLISSVAITTLISKLIYYLVPIIQTALLKQSTLAYYYKFIFIFN